jgi:hypothetical protein
MSLGEFTEKKATRCAALERIMVRPGMVHIHHGSYPARFVSGTIRIRAWALAVP